MKNLFLPKSFGALPLWQAPCKNIPTHWLALLAGCLLCLGTASYAQDFVWAKSMGGSTNEGGRSIAVDASGNVYTTGSFEGTVDFDPGPGTANLTAAGFTDIFVSKLDASGNFVWAKRMGGSSYDGSASIAVDASGNVYTTGYFTFRVDFDPGEATFNLFALLNPRGGAFSDIFVSKLDGDGNFVWAKRMGGDISDIGGSIALDASGNVYTTGFFQNTADFDPGASMANLTSAGASDIFVSKLDGDGNFVWAKSMGGSNGDLSNSIAVDVMGNVYTTGYFQGTADFDPGAATANLTPAGGIYDSDIFVSKLDASGNFVWVKSIGGSGFDSGNSIALDASGNVYTTGRFFDTVDFDPGAATANLTSAGSSDIFVSKLDGDGNFVWARSMGGGNLDGGGSITVDASGNVYTTGGFEGTADFDPGPATFNKTSVGQTDIFISKLGPACMPPTAYGVTGGGAYCAGGTGVVVGLAGSESGVSYQLKLDGNDEGSPVAGTGSALSFGSFTTVGTYTVLATSGAGGCTTVMTGGVTVTVNPLPAASVSGGGTVCEGQTLPNVSFALTGTAPFSFTYSDGTNSTNVSTSANPFVIANASAGTYTVTILSDANGCVGTSSGSASVVVNPLPTVSISGGGTLYLGYGPACTELTATAVGGSGPYTYQWSGGNGSQSTISVCPETTTAYTVTATDGNGCVSAPAEVSVTVIDVRCGNKNDKVTVCHNGKEFCLSANAVKIHLAHGDQLGSCGSQNPAARLGAEELSVQPPQLSLKAYPNPVQDAVTVEVLSRVAGMASFEVLDVTGRARQSRRQELVEGWNEVKFRLGTLPRGVYLIRGVDALGQQGVVRVSKEQ